MLFDPTLGLADELDKYFKVVMELARSTTDSNPYWARCPRCERKQVRENLLENGCFVCGWQGTEQEIEMASIEPNPTEGAEAMPYRTACPNCGARVLTERLAEHGCYVCGWKPE